MATLPPDRSVDPGEGDLEELRGTAAGVMERFAESLVASELATGCGEEGDALLGIEAEPVSVGIPQTHLAHDERNVRNPLIRSRAERAIATRAAEACPEPWHDNGPLAVGRDPVDRGQRSHLASLRRAARDDLDLEIEPGQPGHAEGRPVRIGRLGEHAVLDLHNGAELRFWVSIEGRDIDDVLRPASRRVENR